jgi:restriction endonuclease Mrr
MMRDDLSGPKFVQLFAPVVTALKKLGGSARPAEVADQVARDLGIPEAERAHLLESGTAKFDNSVAWARFYLAKACYIDSSKRGSGP